MKNQNLINTLLLISSCALLISGLIYILLSIFGDRTDTYYLAMGLGFILSGNMFNIIRLQFKKKSEKK